MLFVKIMMEKIKNHHPWHKFYSMAHVNKFIYTLTFPTYHREKLSYRECSTISLNRNHSSTLKYTTTAMAIYP